MSDQPRSNNLTAIDRPEDDLDRLFNRLRPVEPPPNFVAAVMAQVNAPVASGAQPAAPQTAVAASSRRSPAATLAWLALQALGAALVGLAGYWLGQAFWLSGAYDILALAGDDVELIGVYAGALLATMPWVQLAAVAATIAATALTWIYSRQVLAFFGANSANAR